nr:hypothetical protein [Tanacetum cinerariifolium]
MQTQTSNTLHNAIMEAGGKDRPPMLAPDKVVPVSEGSTKTATERYMETYKNVSKDIRDQLNAEAEAVQIILTGIDNDIYSTVDACPNSCEMWKAIERFYKMMNELVRNQCDVTNHQVNVQFLLQLQPEWQRLQQAATRNRGKAIVDSPPSIYDQEPSMKIYKPTNNNLRTSSNTSRANQDNSPRINRGAGYDNQRLGNVTKARETVGTLVMQKSRIQCYNCKEFGNVARECQKPKRVKDAAYHREKMLLCKKEEARIQLNAEQADWRDDTDDESEDQELEAHYMYMAQIQEVSLDAADSGPTFDSEPLQKVSRDDYYNLFVIESEHPEQSKFVHDTYPIEQDEHNMIIDSLDMSYDSEQIDQDDDDDLANERELLASLIEKLKCKIDDSKNHNKFLETSNKILVKKLKGEIDDFKNKNKSLESSNNRFKEANNKLSKTNKLMYNDLKKFQAELDRRNDVKSQLETQKTQFLNEIDRLSREYYYADHMNAILGMYTELDEVTNLQCDYLEMLDKCECLEKELSKSKMILNAKTLNVNFVCATCGKCVLNDKHDMCVLKSLDGVNSRTKMPITVPVSTREPKRTIKQSVAKPLRKIVASESNQKPRNTTTKLYEH